LEVEKRYGYSGLNLVRRSQQNLTLSESSSLMDYITLPTNQKVEKSPNATEVIVEGGVRT